MAASETAGSRAMRMPSSDPEVARVVNSLRKLNCSITRLPNLLPVDLPQHDIDTPNCRDHIRQQPSFAHLRKRLQIGQASRPHMHAVGLRSSITDDVIAHLAARRFYRLIYLARRHGKAFRDDFEVVDERFHLRLHLFAVGQHYPWSVGLDRKKMKTQMEALIYHFKII